jgi:hypothetical protein
MQQGTHIVTNRFGGGTQIYNTAQPQPHPALLNNNSFRTTAASAAGSHMTTDGHDLMNVDASAFGVTSTRAGYDPKSGGDSVALRTRAAMGVPGTRAHPSPSALACTGLLGEAIDYEEDEGGKQGKAAGGRSSKYR